MLLLLPAMHVYCLVFGATILTSFDIAFTLVYIPIARQLKRCPF